MCMGCGVPAGCPFTLTVTLVLLPSSVRVAVPDSPELFWGLSVTVTGPAAPPSRGTRKATRARTRDCDEPEHDWHDAPPCGETVGPGESRARSFHHTVMPC